MVAAISTAKRWVMVMLSIGGFTIKDSRMDSESCAITATYLWGIMATVLIRR